MLQIHEILSKKPLLFRIYAEGYFPTNLAHLSEELLRQLVA